MMRQNGVDELQHRIVPESFQIHKHACIQKFRTCRIAGPKQPSCLAQMPDRRGFWTDARLETMIGLPKIMQERQHCESIQCDILNQDLTSGMSKAGASDRSIH